MSAIVLARDEVMTKEQRDVMETGKALRMMALKSSPKDLGFSPDQDYPKVYGLLMDWRVGEETASILAMRDGTASLYTTSTFGVLGGHRHEAIRRAAKQCAKIANQFLDKSTATVNFAYPKEGEVFFYLLTYVEVRLCIGNEKAINQGSDPTRQLFAAAQNVLTELRLVTEEKM
jgi:hypothetical protein